MVSLKRIGSNVAAQVVALGASMLDRVILVGFILHRWGADLFADYSVLQAAGALPLIAELSVQIYFQNREQEAYANGDRATFRRMTAIHQGVALLQTGLTCVALALFVAGGGASHFHLSRVSARDAAFVLLAFGVGNALTILRSTATALYTALGAFPKIVYFSAAVLALNTAAALAAVALGGGPVVLATLFLVVNGVVAQVWLWRDARRNYREWVSRPSLPTRAEWRDIVLHGRWLSLQVIAPTLWLQLPVLVLDAWRVSGSGIASFLLLRTLTNLIRQGFQFAALGAGLEIAPLAHRGDIAGAWGLTARFGLLSCVLAGSAVAGALFFGQDVIRLWTGNAALFDFGVQAWLLAPVALVAPLLQPFALLQYTNRNFAPGAQKLAQVALGVGLSIAGQWMFGVLGLLAGLAAAETASYLMLVPVLVGTGLFADFGRYLRSAYLVALGAGVFGYAVAFALVAVFPASSSGAIIVLIALWVLFGAAPPLGFALPPEWRSALSRRLRAGRSGR